MTIYNPAGTAIYEAPVTKDAIIKNVLMDDYYIELKFNVAEVMPFVRGCYVMYNSQKFEIMSKVHPEPLSNANGFRYVLKFEAPQGHMKRCKLFWRGGSNLEATFHNTSDIYSFASLIVANVNAFLGNSNWSVGGVPSDIAEQTKLISFNGDSCWDATNMIAETFGVEWWTIVNGDKVSLYFGKLEIGTAEVFKEGDVVSSIPSRNGDDSDYGTRFYVFGSTRNLPSSYNDTVQGGVTNHVSEPRLHLPDGQKYIDAWPNLQPEDVVEQVVFFDDVMPKNTDTVTGISTVEREIIEGQTDLAYVIEAKDTPFTPSDILEGETLGLTFTSGSLMGRSFELSVNESSFDKRFEIIAQTEGSGDNIIIIPNASLKPEVGDTFILTGINLPQARISEAEHELLDVGTSWAAKKSRDTNIYDCPTNAVYCHKNDKNYSLGQKVLLLGEQFGESGRESRIQGYEKKLYDEYQAVYTVGDNTAYSRLGSIEKNIEAAAYAERIGVVKGVGIYVIRSKYDSTPASDENVYSALASEDIFLSKKTGGTVNGPLNVNKDVNVGGDISVGGEIKTDDFEEEALTGKGFGVTRDEEGNTVVTTDFLKVRMAAVFNELVINQTTFQRGTTVFSAAGCEITSVEEIDGVFRCYYDNKDGRRYSGFVAGDQARCQRYDAEYGSIVRYYWRVVSAVGENYVDLYITGKDANGNALAIGLDIPEVGDHIVQFGHRNDPSRQGVIVISSIPKPTILQYDGIYSFALPEPTTKFSPNDNYMSAVLRIKPGSTGLNDMEEFKDLRSEVNSVAIDLEHTNDEVDRYGTLVDEIKEQADKEYIIWFFDHIPTLTNEPARDWTTEELIELHDQDLFYSKPLGRAWRFVDGQWEEITDADTIAALRESNNATQRVDELEGVINNYGVDLEIVKNQLDKEFTIWFAEEDAPEDYIPTNNNYPAVDWNTESLQVLHDQDLFYNRKSGKAWRYEDRAWVEITDADTIEALNKAGEAYDNAERVDHRVDDLAAIIAENKTFVDEVVAPVLDSLQKQIDGAIESFFYEVEPTLDNIPAKDWTTEEQKKAHLNDTYTNLTDGRSWRWTVSGTTYGWTEITDTATAKALQEAGLAKTTADNKRRVFVAQPTNAQAYDEGDLWVNATYGTTYINDLLRCKTAKTEGAAFSISHWELATKYTDDTKANNALAIANESKNYINKVLPGILDELQNQLDGKVESYFYEHVPTASNEPANAWTTEELKKAHLNDTFTNTLTGQSWRWLFKDGTYKWVEIADTQSAEALRVAQEAKAAADGKITSHYGATVNPPYEEGDIWVQGSNGDIYVCINERKSGSYTASDWVKASKYTDDSALNNFIDGAFADTIEEVKSQIDGKAETWYQASDPSSAWTTVALKSAHIGDLWYNTSNNTTSRWSGSKWEAQSVPSEVFDKIDGKADIFVSESRPSAPYNVNDLWSRGDKGQLMICVKKRSAGESTSDSDWAIADDSHKYADDLKDEIEQNFKDDYEYLTKALPVDSNLATTVANAMVLSSLLGVWDNNKNVVSFLNGSDLGKDSTHGKLMFAAGVPTSGANLASRAANAKFRVYEDGTIIAEQGLFKGQVILGDGKITLNQDGSGSLADGSLTWDKYGIMTSVFPIMEKWQDIFTLTTTGSTYTRVNLSQVGYLDNVCQATGIEDTRSIFYLDTANTTMRDGFTLKMRGAIVYNSSLYPAAIRSWNGEKFYAAGRDDGDISFYPETYLVSDTFFMPLGGPPITLTYKQAGGLSANNPYWIVDFPAAYKKVYINQTDGAIYAQTYLDNMDNPSPLSE